MVDIEDKILSISVIKRNGKKTNFDGSKIAVAIKKGFDSVNTDEEKKYNEKDIQKVYQKVIKRIDKEYVSKNIDKIKIEIDAQNNFIAPVSKNNPIGQIKIYIGSRKLNTLQIFTKEAIKRKNFLEYFKEIIGVYANV